MTSPAIKTHATASALILPTLAFLACEAISHAGGHQRCVMQSMDPALKPNDGLLHSTDVDRDPDQTIAVGIVAPTATAKPENAAKARHRQPPSREPLGWLVRRESTCGVSASH
jgi:hypothetical protein